MLEILTTFTPFLGIMAKRASFAGSVLNLAATASGAGILALPSTIDNAGLLLGIFLVPFVALITDQSMVALSRSADFLRSLSRRRQDAGNGAEQDVDELAESMEGASSFLLGSVWVWSIRIALLLLLVLASAALMIVYATNVCSLFGVGKLGGLGLLVEVECFVS